MKHLPNVIAGLRIILSATLFFFVEYPLAFAIVYFCCGISDFADGFIAHRFKAETAIGAKLDSMADFIFFAVVLIIFLVSVHIENEMLILASIRVDLCFDEQYSDMADYCSRNHYCRVFA